MEIILALGENWTVVLLICYCNISKYVKKEEFAPLKEKYSVTYPFPRIADNPE